MNEKQTSLAQTAVDQMKVGLDEGIASGVVAMVIGVQMADGSWCIQHSGPTFGKLGLIGALHGQVVTDDPLFRGRSAGVTKQ